MAEQRKKSQIAEIDRGIYDIVNDFTYEKKSDAGLSEEIVREISASKNEPAWMLERRLKALQIFEQTENPNWGPDLSGLDLSGVTMFIRPKAKETNDWQELPEDIRQTFDNLGILEAEKEALAGVGAQYDSEEVYHSVKQHLLDQGVIYTDFDTAVREYPQYVQEYFQKAIPPTLHKYAALHGAVWSGGSFVYIPAGVQVDIPLQSYYRLNAPGAGQFEHTMIIVEEGASCHFIEGCSAPKYNVTNVHAGSVEIFVKKNARLRFSTIENWSRNMYNLNTKRALVDAYGKIEWVSGSFGSKVSMLYPTSVLRGEYAGSEFTGISFAGEGQILDTGAQALHNAPYTTSMINTKSISAGDGAAIYRGTVRISKQAYGAKSSVSCESLMLDQQSRSDTIPVIDIQNDNIDIGHEAKIGRINEDTIFYLMSRGISEAEAKAMIVRGFAEPIAKELPIEYAVEMNQLINMELEGSIG
ncbi:MAG: Fe-S cluster assembly protein SufB [Eubacteriales bacterium]|nr:Fe-S cluster assembly protein SufB [Eubacteriales bacterium]